VPSEEQSLKYCGWAFCVYWRDEEDNIMAKHVGATI
jgi:hypothetical protein